jgi:hypothetical protein
MIGFGSNHGGHDVYTDGDALDTIAGAGMLKQGLQKSKNLYPGRQLPWMDMA